MALFERLRWLSRSAAKNREETIIHHCEAGAEGKIFEIELERALRLYVNEMIKNQSCIFWLAIGGEAHDFVLPGIDLEPRIIGESRIEQPERMRKMNLLYDLQLVIAAERGRCRRPFTNPVHGQDKRRPEGRRIIG